MRASLLAVALSALCLPGTAAAQKVPKIAVPDHDLFPGALNSEVTQSTIKKTICVPKWTDKVRPTSAFTTRIKVSQLPKLRFHEDGSEEITSSACSDSAAA
jgi:hypothetical protein